MTQEAETVALVKMLREEIVLEYRPGSYSEHRDMNAEESADGILASDWLAAHDAQVRAEAHRELSAEIEAVFDEHYFDGKVLPAYVGAESAARLATIRLIVSKAEETGSTIAESDVTSCCATG